MKRFATSLFFWSWVVTAPITVFGAYISYDTLDRFLTYSVRYDPRPLKIPLSRAANYAIDARLQDIRVGMSRFGRQASPFRTINLFVPEANLATLESHMPQSGFEYVKALILFDGRMVKAKIRYRGDFWYHWAWGKKSLRVKTDKDRLFEGIRTFNLQAPKFQYQLNNYLALRLAEQLDLIAPKTELVNVNVNRVSRGIHVFVEQLEEEALRRRSLMPADVYRGEMIGKDRFTDIGAKKLFETASVWDKVAVNNHYPEASMAPLEHFIELIRDQDDYRSQRRLSEFLDLDAWARFSAFETLAQTRHFGDDHNWRFYYDPWREKLVPIVWDPVGWAGGWWPKGDNRAIDEVIITRLHEALFKNGDFVRARNKVLQEYFAEEKDAEFLRTVSETVATMDQAIRHDRLLRPADPALVSRAMHDLEATIREIFADTREIAFGNPEDVHWMVDGNALLLWIEGRRPVLRLRVESYAGRLEGLSQAFVVYTDAVGRRSIDVSAGVIQTDSELVFNLGALPDLEITRFGSGPFPNNVSAFPAFYRLELARLPSAGNLHVSIDMGAGWQMVEPSSAPDVAERKSDLEKDAGQHGWQIFWNTGSGFSRDQTTRTMSVGRSADDQRWSLSARLPGNVRKLRIDPPVLALEISDVRVTVDGVAHSIPVLGMRLHGMRVDRNKLRLIDVRDPYFSFDAPADFDGGKAERDVEVSFRVGAETPWQTRLKTGRVGRVNNVFAPVAANPRVEPLVWSGDIVITGTREINQPLIIEPGTRLLMDERATLILTRRLHAVGTSDEPIQIVPRTGTQQPWGAVVLRGERATGSRLAHCSFSGGSGLKGDLFEYTGMLSVHDVSDVVIRDCVFRDSQLTDDMLHAVYSDLRLERTSFLNAPADAVDLDVSSAVIIDSRFENNGNDGLDLMTTDAQVAGCVFNRNGDKGISVGEDSKLIVVDSRMIGNGIGLQSKDASLATLVNVSFEHNTKAMDAYKKNWQYGVGGTIVATKARIENNSTGATAGRRSRILLFDSYWDAPASGPKVVLRSVDNREPTTAAEAEVWPGGSLNEAELRDPLEEIDRELLTYIRPARRGSYEAPN